MTTARLISLGIGIGLTDVLANGGADVLPVGWGHRGGGGFEGFEQFGFELDFVGEVGLNEGLDVVVEGGVCSGGDLGCEIGGEVFGDFKLSGDLHDLSSLVGGFAEFVDVGDDGFGEDAFF